MGLFVKVKRNGSNIVKLNISFRSFSTAYWISSLKQLFEVFLSHLGEVVYVCNPYAWETDRVAVSSRPAWKSSVLMCGRVITVLQRVLKD